MLQPGGLPLAATDEVSLCCVAASACNCLGLFDFLLFLLAAVNILCVVYKQDTHFENK